MDPLDRFTGQTDQDSSKSSRSETSRLSEGAMNLSQLIGMQEEVSPQIPEINYRVVPLDDSRRTFDSASAQPWRITLVPVGLTAKHIALEVLGDCIVGSNPEPHADLDVNLVSFDGWMRGVSRRHLMLRPSLNKLFVMDMRSTNGTQVNGLPLGIGWAYALKDNDLISLAKLHVRVHIVQSPKPQAPEPPNPFESLYKR